jgi:hypothetical protein
MSNLTETVVDGASRDADERQEWLPPQIEQELKRPFFTRLTTDERLRRHGQPRKPAPARRTRRFAPSPTKLAATAPRPAVAVREPVASREPQATNERVAAREPAPAPESAGSEMLRRLSEVEARVASAARAVDLSASNVRTLVERNGKSG